LVRVIRGPILVGGALGYGLGLLLGLASGGVINPLLVALCYLVVALGDLSTHYSNDYYDVGLDRFSPRKTFGGSNLLVGRPDLMLPALGAAKLMSIASVALSILAAAMGVSPLIVPLALAANALGWIYSLPPLKLAYRGFGETAIAVGTGFGIPAAGYIAVQGSLDSGFMLISSALVLYGFVLGLNLELPDEDADRVGGKMNLVARFGSKTCLRLALLLCIVSTVMLALFASISMAAASIIPLAAVLVSNLIATGNRYRLDVVSTGSILSLFAFLVASVGSLLI
jgi:1,4-dihydroxy-2-naphthoate octaprenyltransferase